MTKERKCEDCGKDISDRVGRTKICLDCRKKRDRKSVKANAELAKKKAKENPTKKKRFCYQCKAEIIGRGNNAKYCFECDKTITQKEKSLNRKGAGGKKHPCRGCIHWRLFAPTESLYACHYILDYGAMRNCEQENCDKYTRDKSKLPDTRNAKHAWAIGSFVQNGMENEKF